MTRRGGGWVLLALLPLAASAVDRAPVTGAAFGARFTLEVTVAAGPPERSEGRIFLLPDGRFCVRVERPIRQDMLLGRERIVLHYPERSLVLAADVRGGQAPPVIEALFAGLGEASRLLPAGSRLAERSREGGILRSRWIVPSADASEVRVEEAIDGMRSFALHGEDGVLRRRFEFDRRVRVGRLSVPMSARGDYRGKGGAPARAEAWALTDLTPSVPPDLARECAGEGARFREPLPW